MNEETFDKKWERAIWIGTPYADMQRLFQWARIQGIKKKINQRRGDWTQFSGRRFQHVRGISRPALYEEAALFERFDGTKVLTLHPFKINESFSTCDRLLKWCSIRGLHITYVSEDLSWFKPRRSVLYQIEIQDESKYIDFIDNNKKKATIGWVVE